MFQHVKAAFDLDLPRSEKFVLVALSRYADAEGYCYPGIERLARDTSSNERTVMRAIKSLVKRGLVEKEIRSTSRGRSSNGYQLRLGQQHDIDDTQPDTMSSCPPAQQNTTLATRDAKPATRKPKLDYEAFRVYWNENIPPHWTSCRVINKDRKTLIDKLARDVGVDHAFDAFAAAVRYVTNDEWWLAKADISIQNVMTNGKVIDYAEKQLAIEARGNISGEQVASTVQAVGYYNAILEDDYAKN